MERRTPSRMGTMWLGSSRTLYLGSGGGYLGLVFWPKPVWPNHDRRINQHTTVGRKYLFISVRSVLLELEWVTLRKRQANVNGSLAKLLLKIPAHRTPTVSSNAQLAMLCLFLNSPGRFLETAQGFAIELHS